MVGQYNSKAYEVTSRLRRQKRDYFLLHLNQHKANPKEFWKTVRFALQSKKQTANINKLVVENKELTEPKLIANSLNSYFTKIADSVPSNGYQRCGTRSFSTSPTVSTLVADHGQQSFDSFGFKHISNEEVYNALISMNTTKATGGDDIPAKAIKLVAGQIAPSIAYLFNESFNLGTFPSS